MPRIAEGRALRSVASACMDTSDGLVATLDQLARLNQVAVRVDAPLESLLDPRAEAQRRELGLSALPFLACQHGEFELVFGVPEAKRDLLDAAARAIGWRPVRLGRVDPGAGLFLGATALDGARVRNLSALARSDLTSYVGALCSL